MKVADQAQRHDRVGGDGSNSKVFFGWSHVLQSVVISW